MEALTVTRAYQNAGGGGAVFIRGASPTIRRCIFTESTAPSGGAIQAVQASHPVIEDCHFEDNHATTYGGAIDLESGGASLWRCRFFGNTSATTGGAVVTNQAVATIDSCTFVGNTAQSGGALACYQPAGAAVVTNCTFHGNGAVNGGSVISAYGAVPTLDRCILASGIQGAAIYCVPGAGATLTCSDVYDNAGGDWVGCIAGQEGSNGNFSADPRFCAAESRDFTLRDDSPCSPEHSPEGCGCIGAYGVGCTATDVPDESVVDIPVEFYLGPAVPNPFTGKTEITYGIPGAGPASRVVMKVYDVAGRLVTTLVEAEQGPGRYRRVWGGTDRHGNEVPAGVYFYRITWNRRVEIRRTVIIK